MCLFSSLLPQSQKTGSTSKIPSTWFTPFDPPWRFPETLPHPTYGTTQAAFPYEWLLLAHTAQLPKSSQTSSSWPQCAPGPALAAASLDSHLDFTWESPSPTQVAPNSFCFITQDGCLQAKHRWGLILACNTLETPRPAHPVDSD